MSHFTCTFASMKAKHCNIEHITKLSLSKEPHIEGRGGIIMCEKGQMSIKVNFTNISIKAQETMTLYPTDIIVGSECSDDFSALAFWYDEGVLREASMHIEDSVYSILRNDRVCREANIVQEVISPMFVILSHFYSVDDCEVFDEIAVAQLKSFFMGFYDFTSRHSNTRVETQAIHNDSQRTNELFSKFMHDLEHYYKESRDVQYYADRLYITRKYLGIIVNRKTGRTPKQLIDEYVIMQLKLSLRHTNDSIRQIASSYNFTDDSLLIRYFRSHTGMTPVQYRRT